MSSPEPAPAAGEVARQAGNLRTGVEAVLTGGDADMSVTAALILLTALMEAVHGELLELGMWQAWSGR